jgi:DNA-binding FadR family transcriptional regulator
MRATEYGVEYRTMSNYWTKNPLFVGLMWHIAEDMLFYMKNYPYEDLLKHMGHDDIQKIINDGDVEGAEFMMENYVNNVFSDETQELFLQAEEVMNSDTE